MTDIAIRVENLGKQYRIGAQQERYKTLRESLVGAVTGPLRRLRHPQFARFARNPQSEIIWALKDVSFEVKPGEVVGIIGRNGAGKSTLLKILSRITEPSEGRVELRGRVGSLLEVGTGFHQELTGRENIYLNGAILGMKRAEIERKFDEIVAFAEIDKFIDTPVKRYSSGMYVRLAFAVAAYLEPEILLVDEVLAVGDAAFQKKCLGKMGDVAKQGRTVLFVSHNMAAVQRLCGKCLVLESGRVVENSQTNQAVAMYLQQLTAIEEHVASGEQNVARVRQLGFYKVGSQESDFRFDTEETFEFRMEYELKTDLIGARVAVWFLTAEGFVFMCCYDTDTYSGLATMREIGKYCNRMIVPASFLNAGEYTIRVLVYVPHGKVYFDDSSLFLQITDSKGESAHTGWGHRVGPIVPRFDWKVGKFDNQDKNQV
jgi:lipopolysaccharide transport system ATP-binding protein